MPLINCENKLKLIWPEDCIISTANGKTKFAVTDTTLHVPVVTL